MLCNVEVTLKRQLATNRRLRPSLAALGEDGMQVAFEQSTGVLEALFGVGFCGGDAVERFVEDADDPPLFGEGIWILDDEFLQLGLRDGLPCRTATLTGMQQPLLVRL